MPAKLASSQSFRAEWTLASGERITVEGLPSVEDAYLVQDVLQIKEALNAGRSLDTLRLHRPYGPSRLDRLNADSQGRGTSVPDLVRQLQECAAELRKHPGRAKQTLMHVAASRPSSIAALQLLAAAAPGCITATCERGRTPLHCAAECALQPKGGTAALQFLTALAPEAARIADSAGWTPLARAMRQPASRAAAILIEAVSAAAAGTENDGLVLLQQAAYRQKGRTRQRAPAGPPMAALWEDPWGGRTLLHHAAGLSGPTAGAVRLLLAAGWGQPHARDDEGRTPLHHAAVAGNLAAVAALLSAAPSSVNARSKTGERPLHLSVCHSDTATMQLLLEAAPEAAFAPDPELFGQTIMFQAAMRGSPAAVRLLLQLAPQTASAVMDTNYAPLHFAAARTDAAVFELLLEAAPEAAGRVADSGQTVLHFAAGRGCLATVQRLLEVAPETVNRLDFQGWTAAHAAAGRQDADAAAVLQLLLQAAPSTAGHAANDGQTPLHITASVGVAAAVRILLEAVPETATTLDELGRSPLFLSVGTVHTLVGMAIHEKCQDLAVAQLLLDAAPQMVLVREDESGWTPLHHAAYACNVAAIGLLTAAAPQAAGMTDQAGRTPLQLALETAEEEEEASSGLDNAAKIQSAFDGARTLLSVGSPAAAAQALVEAGEMAEPLFADFVASRLPLSADVWALMPNPCQVLGRALPATVAHSPEQARQLVSRLPGADVERLRVAALALNRAQKACPACMPIPLFQRILALMFV